MSSTVTQTITTTIPQTQQYTLHLRRVPLIETIRKQILELIKDLSNSGLLNSKFLKRLQANETEIIQNFPENLDDNANREAISDQLCILLLEIINPSIAFHDNPDIQVTLLEFADKIKEMLSKCIPKGVDLDAYIEETCQYLEEWKTQNKILRYAQNTFQTTQNQLCKMGNEIQDEIEGNFERIKESLKNASNKRSDIASNLKKRVISITERLLKETQDLRENSLAVAESASDIGTQQQVLNSQLTELDGAFR